MRIATVIVAALLSGTATAAEPFPTLAVPDPSDPAVAAFVAWHAALIKGDFYAYRRFTPEIPNMSDEMLREVFNQPVFERGH